MDIRIQPTRLTGQVTPPPSKSMAHRAVLAQFLSEAPGEIFHLGDSQDIQATKRCVAALKAATRTELPLLDCGESGSTLRFLLPLALAIAGGGRFIGRGRLMERPQQPYFDLFKEKGIFYHLENGMLTVQGALPPGDYSLPGHISSQFVTGLLYALPLLDGSSLLHLTTPLASRGYVDMTLELLRQFGLSIENQSYECFWIPGNQHYRGTDITLESDWSHAAFWYAAVFLDNPVELRGLSPVSRQGDRVITEYMLKMKAPGELSVDLTHCPDLLPALAVMAAVRNGATRFLHAARLRLKESDRLTATAALLHSLGGSVRETADELLVFGGQPLSGGTVDGFNDHRIVMAAAIAATVCIHSVTILGGEAVNKSYPAFWKDYTALGGRLDVL